MRDGLELLPAAVTSTSPTPSTEVFRTTLPALAAGDVLRFMMATTSTAATAANARRVQVGYRKAPADTFASLGQYVVNSASGGSIRGMSLQCVPDLDDFGNAQVARAVVAQHVGDLLQRHRRVVGGGAQHAARAVGQQ